MSSAKCVLVLFLVSLYLRNFSCAHRVLIDDNKHEAAMADGSGGAGGSGSDFGGPSCGGGQPWYQPPGPGCGCSGGEGSTQCCGNNGGGVGGFPVPLPISCPVGCQPAFAQPNMVQWVYSWPTFTVSSPESKTGRNGGEKPNSEPKDYGKETRDSAPMGKEKQDSEPHV